MRKPNRRSPRKFLIVREEQDKRCLSQRYQGAAVYKPPSLRSAVWRAPLLEFNSVSPRRSKKHFS
jgi:hypothetical protein